MKRTHFAFIIASIFSMTAAPSLAADSTSSEKSITQKVRDPVKPDFKKADKDKDGTLDRTEAAAMPDVAAHFDAMDTDADGVVSKDEIKTHEKFVNTDKDNDGTLDRKEAKFWLTVSRNFDAMDTDSEGTVSLKEVNAYMVAKEKHAANTK